MKHSTQENELDRFKPDRRSINAQIGMLVKYGDLVFRISEIIDFNTVVATGLNTGRNEVLRINELSALDRDPEAPSDVDLNEIADQDWQAAQTRYAAIEPLIKVQSPSREEVNARALAVGVSSATLYRWIARYKVVGATSGLVSFKRGWNPGKKRITADAEKVIEGVLRTFFLTPERPCPEKVVREVHRLCAAQGIMRPSPNTIRARIADIPEYERLRKRGKVELAKSRRLPTPGTFPGADYPLAVVEIDHTRVDIILVDDIYRKPIDRPWITVAIDVFSRMVVGYYLTFDAPSVTSVAMCIANAILPKDDWLRLHKVEGEWPVWGRPKKIHVDNGPDFRSADLRNSCKLYGIDLEFRPVRVPRYGGHVERQQGTLMREIQDIPGTTFSSVKDRDGYDSEARAIMTIDEFEYQLLTLICNEYHRRVHSRIGMPPLRKWELGIFGGAGYQGIGMPAIPADRHTIVLDFLPSFEKTIQNDGVTHNCLRYYDDALRPWIGERDRETGKGRRFTFRMDPRDVSVLWFFDPYLKSYFKIRLTDLSQPPFSIWEHRRAREELRAAGHNPSDEKAVFRSIGNRRKEIGESASKTKKARREQQRNGMHSNKVNPADPLGISPQGPITGLLSGPSASLGLSDDVDAPGDIA